jgi:hypothetical protein
VDQPLPLVQARDVRPVGASPRPTGPFRVKQPKGRLPNLADGDSVHSIRRKITEDMLPAPVALRMDGGRRSTYIPVARRRHRCDGGGGRCEGGSRGPSARRLPQDSGRRPADAGPGDHRVRRPSGSLVCRRSQVETEVRRDAARTTVWPSPALGRVRAVIHDQARHRGRGPGLPADGPCALAGATLFPSGTLERRPSRRFS